MTDPTTRARAYLGCPEARASWLSATALGVLADDLNLDDYLRHLAPLLAALPDVVVEVPCDDVMCWKGSVIADKLGGHVPCKVCVTLSTPPAPYYATVAAHAVGRLVRSRVATGDVYVNMALLACADWLREPTDARRDACRELLDFLLRGEDDEPPAWAHVPLAIAAGDYEGGDDYEDAGDDFVIAARQAARVLDETRVLACLRAALLEVIR